MLDHRHIKMRSGLPHTSAKLMNRKPITAAFLGGSITEGAGASSADETSWRALTGRYVMARFPGQPHRFINAGVGGTTSTFGAHRLQDHVLKQGKIDLLFVEFSVNDGEDRDESIRGMEGIVRQCRRLSPHTDLVFIYTAADKNLTDELPFNIAVHEEVAVHYDISSVNLAGGVRDLILEGKAVWENLAPDRVHPNDDGYALYALYVSAFLNEALPSDIDADGNSRRPAAYHSQLPAPLDPNNYEFAAMEDSRPASIREGFQLAVLGGEPLMNWRFDTTHLAAEGRQGESVTFTSSGQRAGIVLLHGPDSGIFEYAFDGGTFEPMNLFDEWCLLAYRPVLAMFPFQPGKGERQVTIRCTGTKDDRSKGTAIRILKLLSS